MYIYRSDIFAWQGILCQFYLGFRDTFEAPGVYFQSRKNEAFLAIHKKVNVGAKMLYQNLRQRENKLRGW